MNTQGYNQWFARQVRQMVASDNISYRMRDAKKYVFGQIRNHCKARFCNQTLSVGGVLSPARTLGGPL